MNELLGRLVVVLLAAGLPVACGGSTGTGGPCAGVDCSGRGFCVADQGMAFCACIRGHHPAGLACVPAGVGDPCLAVQCSGHGRCREIAGEAMCECDDGYHHPSGLESDCAPDAGEDASTCVPGAPEVCDGRDNDCDGLTDETFDLDFDPANCGACGHACADGPNATRACILRECTVTCAPGWSDLDGSPADGCEAACTRVEPADETSCSGRDDDCDGLTDEDWAATMQCGTGLCERSAMCFHGAEQCFPRLPPADTDETCDGLDDNCDGLTDEDCGADADADADADGDADAEADADAADGADGAAGCGDGVRQPGEECDDGNDVADDGCRPDCTLSCHVLADCDDRNSCTVDSCDAVATGQQCSHVPSVAATCDDGDPSTDRHWCTAAGACVGVRCPPPSPCPYFMAYVPCGPFIMGSDPGEGDADEEPEHVVYLSAYCIDLVEVMNINWSLAGGPTPAFGYGPEDYPVVGVDINQARNHCLSVGERLPTEAEWEKAARGGCEVVAPESCGPEDERTYPWGTADPTAARANFAESVPGTDAAGSRLDGRSPYGVYNMAGNVSEWVADRYGDYSSCAVDCADPLGPASAPYAMDRGGGWRASPEELRAAHRSARSDIAVMDDLGLRCASDP